jgi:hypothetical protein
MATTRIKDISTTATSPHTDDVVAIDGATNGTRKINAGPLGGVFDENITTTGEYQSENNLVISADPNNDGSSSKIEFRVDGTSRAEITNSGNFVVSAGKVEAVNSGNSTQFSASNGTVTTELLTFSGTASFGTSTSHDFKIMTGGSERLRVDSSGRLGVNNSAPGSYNSSANNLVVGDGANHEGLTIASGTAHQGGVYFADGTVGAAQYAGFIYYDHDVNTFRIGTNGATVASIDGSGRLGIGTSSPGSYYSEADDLVIGSVSGDRGITVVSGTSGTGSLFFADGTSGADAYRGQIRYLHGSNELMFAVNSNEAFRIGSGGDIVMASGNGIDFGAVAGGTGTPATDGGLLNDFERGSFTPSFTSTGTAPTLTYLAQVGTYTKVGNLVTCHGRVRVNAVTGAGTGSLQISGLPFATQNVSNLGSGGSVCLAAFFGTSSSGCPTHISGGNNATVMTLKTLKNSAGVVASLDNTDAADLAGNCYVDFSITYTTA